MKIYADRMRHIICVPYTIANLHRMAERLEIKRCWYHRHFWFPHYDSPKKRLDEILVRDDVIEVTARELVEICKREIRKRGPLHPKHKVPKEVLER